jgi:hypothetical protein
MLGPQSADTLSPRRAPWSPEVAHTRAKLAGLSRRPHNDPELLAARRAHRAAVAKDYYARLLAAPDKVPPLSREELDELAAFFQASAVTP